MIVGESTEEIPQIASKGLYEIRAEFSGVRVHSSNPNRGENAIYKALEFVNELHNFSEKLHTETDKIFGEVSWTTYNIGKISGGDSVNTTAESCWLTIDFRTISAESQRMCRTFVASLATKFNTKITILNSVEPFFNALNKNLPAILGKKFGAGIGLIEASFLPPTCQKIILGPGPKTAHEPNEFVWRKSLTKIVKIYEKMINDVKWE